MLVLVLVLVLVLWILDTSMLKHTIVLSDTENKTITRGDDIIIPQITHYIYEVQCQTVTVQGGETIKHIFNVLRSQKVPSAVQIM